VKVRNLAVLGLVAATAGCYHATVETGLTPGSTTVETPWAHSFLYGLVPPATVDAASDCSSGVSRVETQLSFLNMVANAITFGIYSPMHITVTCAAGSMEEAAAADDAVVIDAAGSDAQALEAALNQAMVRSLEAYGAPVYVRTP